MFHFEIELKFKAHRVDSEEVWTEGKIKVHEFYNDDDEVELNITIDKSSDDVPSEFLEKVKQSINSMLKSKIANMIVRFMEEFKQ